MRYLLITSNRSVSLQNVAEDIAAVAREEGHEADIQKYLPVYSNELFSKYDSVIFTMTINLQYGMPFFVWYRKFRMRAVPTLFYGVTEGKPRRTLTDGWVFRDVEFVVPSQFVRDMVEEEGGSVVEVVPHGIDADYVQEKARLGKLTRKELGLRDDDVVVLYVAAGYPRKAHELFSSIAKKIAEQDPAYKVVVVTDEQGSIWYKQTPNIKVVPEFGSMTRDEVLGYFQAADVYAHPSYAEGFGLPVLEAVASGKPVVHPDYQPLSEITTTDISFRVPVLKTKWVDGNDGMVYLYHMYDPDEFTEAVFRAIDAVQNRNRREQIALRAVERAREFDMYRVYSRLLELASKAI